MFLVLELANFYTKGSWWWIVIIVLVIIVVLLVFTYLGVRHLQTSGKYDEKATKRILGKPRKETVRRTSSSSFIDGALTIHIE